MSDRDPVLPPPPPEVVAAISALVAYSWEDEVQDYLDDPDPDHAFAKLVAVDNWLTGTALTPDEAAAAWAAD